MCLTLCNDVHTRTVHVYVYFSRKVAIIMYIHVPCAKLRGSNYITCDLIQSIILCVRMSGRLQGLKLMLIYSACICTCIM